jgi:hypothetical protein
MAAVEEVEVVVAHYERATLRVGDVFLMIDADQTRTDVEVEAMAMAPVPTPEVLWRKPPVLALAAVGGTALGHLGEPSAASPAAWAAAGTAARMLHDAPLPPWPGRSPGEIASNLDGECEWLVANGVLPADLVTRNRRIAEAALRPWTPVFTHGDLQITHVFVECSSDVSDDAGAVAAPAGTCVVAAWRPRMRAQGRQVWLSGVARGRLELGPPPFSELLFECAGFPAGESAAERDKVLVGLAQALGREEAELDGCHQEVLDCQDREALHGRQCLAILVVDDDAYLVARVREDPGVANDNGFPEVALPGECQAGRCLTDPGYSEENEGLAVGRV